MGRLSPGARRQLEAQGFVGVSESVLLRIHLWIRLTPAITLLWVLVGTLMESAWVIAALVPLFMIGAFTRNHPFDFFYDRWLRTVFRSPSLPPAPFPKRFTSLVTAILLALQALAYLLDIPEVALALGLAIMTIQFIYIATGFCVIATLYEWMFGRADRYRV